MLGPGQGHIQQTTLLSGILGAMLGQGLSPFTAARTAVYLHALCAEAFSHSFCTVNL